MDDTTLILAIAWVAMMAMAYGIAQSRGRSTKDALVLTMLLGPIGLFIVALDRVNR